MRIYTQAMPMTNSQMEGQQHPLIAFLEDCMHCLQRRQTEAQRDYSRVHHRDLRHSQAGDLLPDKYINGLLQAGVVPCAM